VGGIVVCCHRWWCAVDETKRSNPALLLRRVCWWSTLFAPLIPSFTHSLLMGSGVHALDALWVWDALVCSLCSPSQTRWMPLFAWPVASLLGTSRSTSDVAILSVLLVGLPPSCLLTFFGAQAAFDFSLDGS
jgi:hypothetical protein